MHGSLGSTCQHLMRDVDSLSRFAGLADVSNGIARRHWGLRGTARRHCGLRGTARRLDEQGVHDDEQRARQQHDEDDAEPVVNGSPRLPSRRQTVWNQ